MYHGLKSTSGKIKLSEMYSALKSNSGKINFQDATSRLVGPVTIFVGAHTVIINASDDQLVVAKEQLSHLKEVRKLLDPEGYGKVVEKPKQTLAGRGLLWLKQHQISGSDAKLLLKSAMSFLKPSEISAEEWAEIMWAEIMFNSLNPF